MKTKKFQKTLVLTKTTIANLGNEELNRVLGGNVTHSCSDEPAGGCASDVCLTYEQECQTMVTGNPGCINP